ncbi:MAG: hypothetical protein ACM3XM_13530 [Mycobacterium leprae]
MPRVVALFQSQFRIDRCIGELEQQGFTPAEMSIILLEAQLPKRPRTLQDWLAGGGLFGDTMDQSDGVSVMDGMTVGGSIGGLVGLVWGSRLAWGPIAVGFVGILLGGLVGLVIDRLIKEKRRGMYQTSKLKGLMLLEIVSPVRERLELALDLCQQNEADQVALVAQDRVPST